MAITKSSARQEIVHAYVDIPYTALTVSGTDYAAISLPVSAIVVGGQVVPTTAFNSATSDVLDVGDSASQNRYLNDANIAGTTRAALIPTGYKTLATTRDITVRWVGAGAAPSAGSVRLEVQYIVLGRAAFAQD